MFGKKYMYLTSPSDKKISGLRFCCLYVVFFWGGGSYKFISANCTLYSLSNFFFSHENYCLPKSLKSLDIVRWFCIRDPCLADSEPLRKTPGLSRGLATRSAALLLQIFFNIIRGNQAYDIYKRRNVGDCIDRLFYPLRFRNIIDLYIYVHLWSQ